MTIPSPVRRLRCQIDGRIDQKVSLDGTINRGWFEALSTNKHSCQTLCSSNWPHGIMTFQNFAFTNKRSPLWPFIYKQTGKTSPKGGSIMSRLHSDMTRSCLPGSTKCIALHPFQLVLVPNNGSAMPCRVFIFEAFWHAQFTTHQIHRSWPSIFLSCRSVISLPCYDDDGVYLGILGLNRFLTNRCGIGKVMKVMINYILSLDVNDCIDPSLDSTTVYNFKMNSSSWCFDNPCLLWFRFCCRLHLHFYSSLPHANPTSILDPHPLKRIELLQEKLVVYFSSSNHGKVELATVRPRRYCLYTLCLCRFSLNYCCGSNGMSLFSDILFLHAEPRSSTWLLEKCNAGWIYDDICIQIYFGKI